MICQINRKRLITFEYNPNQYKGIRIGDVIKIPESQCEKLDRRMVMVTGFNRDYDIIHWRSPSIFGGLAHSGTFYNEIEQHIAVRL